MGSVEDFRGNIGSGMTGGIGTGMGGMATGMGGKLAALKTVLFSGCFPSTTDLQNRSFPAVWLDFITYSE